MIAPPWWFDLKQYAERLQHCSDEELLDIYFHIDPIRYRAHYWCVLRELRRRGVKPQVAHRPFAGVAWDLPQWVGALGWLGRSRAASRVMFGLLTLVLSASLTGLGLTPVWLATLLTRYLDPFTALALLMGAVWAFLWTRAFARIVDALHQPLGSGGGWGF